MLIHKARKESISEWEKKFDKKLGVPNELTKKEIEESDKRFVEKLIQIFRDVKNKVKS